MEISPLSSKIDASAIAPERLAGSTRLSEAQKINEASRQFEAILLRQILQNTQKTVISSKYSDNSTSAGIYKDMMVEHLADSISKSGAFGLANTFEQQLNRPPSVPSKAGEAAAATAPPPTSQPGGVADRPEILAGKFHRHGVRPAAHVPKIEKL